MPAEDRLIHNDSVVHGLSMAISEGALGIRHVPELLATVLRERMWAERMVSGLDRVVAFDSFHDFVTTPPIKGLGTTMDVIKALVRDTEAEELLDEETKPSRDVGRPKKGGTLENSGNAGVSNRNDRDGAIARIKKLASKGDAMASEALEAIKAKQMSVHQAAIYAGIRKPSDPLRALQRTWCKATDEQREAFLDWVGEQR